MSTDVYQACPCGSGKKNKFCCYAIGQKLKSLNEQEIAQKSVEYPIQYCQTRKLDLESGLIEVLVVRQLPHLKYLVGMYLIDTFCLGLKETRLKINYKLEQIEKDFQIHVHSHPILEGAEVTLQDLTRWHETPYEEVRSLILGCIDYAARWQFTPASDWAWTQHLLEPGRSFVNDFPFGHNGKPLYIQDPHDNVSEIVQKLTPWIEKDEASCYLYLNHRWTSLKSAAALAAAEVAEEPSSSPLLLSQQTDEVAKEIK